MQQKGRKMFKLKSFLQPHVYSAENVNDDDCKIARW